ncbi:uncharacterized protein BYT42DRAFT_558536 [Radiomyces spectabilis]|uniref:uncharacterized protein n=1 Tax=Radiomyces spectabilis TaxID=64574 RepID=UPI00221EA59A|nr:uncharacterized protein BYT42DRAFT_558536 [Radiomyces spectabilis]KAI8387991.1 hypothetical protein BYT42DRAFT_558536 [Radiomyces spectabilis]
MNTWQGFVFTDPKEKVSESSDNKDKPHEQSTPDPEATTTAKEPEAELESVNWSELTTRFAQTDIAQGTDRQTERQQAFHTSRAPILHRTSQEAHELRRARALESQRQHRKDRLTEARRIVFAALSDEDESEATDSNEGDDGVKEEITETQSAATKRGRDEDSDDAMDVYMDSKILRIEPKRKPKNGKQRKKNGNKLYANQIMYAETMEDIPNDLLENWVVVICPVGKRCMVTSGKGRTVARSRDGRRFMNGFQSVLPSGSPSKRRSSDVSILDCVYDFKHWTFYVLDMMCWRDYSIYDCDTDFRHFWLQTKITQDEMDTPTSENRFYRFKALAPVPPSELNQILVGPKQYVQQQGFDYEIDGLLFYHRQTQYINGSTPLVCWVPLADFDSLRSHLNQQQI